MINIVIVNYNSWQHSIEAIASIQNSNIDDYKIILIENNSLDNSEDKIDKWLNGNLLFKIQNNLFKEKIKQTKNSLNFTKYKLKENKLICIKSTNDNNKPISRIIFAQTNKNLGFAGGNNFAVNNFIDLNQKSDILFLNPDMHLDKNAINHALNYTKDYSKYLLGFRIMTYDNPNQMFSIGGSTLNSRFNISEKITDYDKIYNLDYIYGGALFTNTETLKDIGPMNEEYFLFWEEADLCQRAKRKSIPLLVSKKSICYNKIGQSIGRGEMSFYLYTYNSFVFFNKFFEVNKKLYMKHIIKIFIAFIKFEYKQALSIKSAILDFYLNRKNRYINE